MSSLYPSKSDYKRMLSLYGENKIIDGLYDKNLAVKCHNGVFIGKLHNEVVSYKGIPFAKPPIKELRWKGPVCCDESNEVREAYYFGHSAIQAPWYSELASCYPQSEDCLYLNIWLNKNTQITDKKAVMVFIHGGAYGYGGTADPLYDGYNFISAHPDVILVTIAYRIGITGFIDFSSLKGSEGYEDSCNLGILDQIEALKWIQNNISFFGGDPSNVTIFGESAGGGSVSILAVLDIARGLFKRAIAQSGSVSITFSREECQAFTNMLVEKTHAQNMQDLLSLSTKQLQDVNLLINDRNNFPMRDGRIIPEDLYEAYFDGKSISVDMMAGSNKDECCYWVGEIGGIIPYASLIPILFENQCAKFSYEDKMLAKEYFINSKGVYYKRLTEFENDIIFRVPAQKQLLLHSDNGGKAYHYFWTYESSIRGRGACHAVELSSVFNNPYEIIFTGENYDEKLANEVQNMWVNFAKCGDPSTENNKWEKYTSDSKKTMVLGKKIFVKENLFSRRTKIIEKLLKYYLNGNYGELNLNISFIRTIIAFIMILIIIVIFILLLIFCK